MTATICAVGVCLLALAATSPVHAVAAPGFGAIKGPGGCLRPSGQPASAECGKGTGIVHPEAIAVSPDGTSIYVVGGTTDPYIAGSFGSVAILRRDPTTGEVTDVGCMSSDGTDGRDGASGACTPMPSLLGADGVAVSADGRDVFISSWRSGSVAAFARDPSTGLLTRIGCLSRGPSTCVAANIFRGSTDIVVGPGDSALYLASPLEGTVSAVIAPPPATSTGATPAPGASSRLASLFVPPTTPGAPDPALPASPCVAVNGYDGGCAVGVAMQKVSALTVSPDGKQLYAAAPDSHAVDVFAAGGEVPTEIGCLKAEAPPGLCSDSKLLASPSQLAISPDARFLYAADTSSGHGARIDVLARDPGSGKLSDSSCVDLLPEPPKAEAGGGEEETEEEQKERQQQREHEEQVERERLASDPCHGVPGLGGGLQALAVSGDGTALWALGEGEAVSFSRDPATGKLTETACASTSDTRCATESGLSGVNAAAVSPDGRDVYVVTHQEQAFVAFGLGAGVSATGASVDRAGIARLALACPAQLRRPCRGRLILTRGVRLRSRHARARHVRIAAGASPVFAIRAGARAVVAVHLFASARGLALGRGRLRVTATVRGAARGGGAGLGTSVLLRELRR